MIRVVHRGSRCWLSPIPGAGVKKVLDPGSGTLCDVYREDDFTLHGRLTTVWWRLNFETFKCFLMSSLVITRFDLPGIYKIVLSFAELVRGWEKTMQGWCVPDRKFLDVAPLKQSVPWILCPDHGPRSVDRYRGLGRPPAPNESVGRLAGFAYAPDQVYWIGALPSDARSAHIPLRSAKARGSWKSGVASLNQIKGMGWFSQGHNRQGTLCPRDATSKNFPVGDTSVGDGLTLHRKNLALWDSTQGTHCPLRNFRGNEMREE